MTFADLLNAHWSSFEVMVYVIIFTRWQSK